MASIIQTFKLEFLDDFEDLENVSEMVAETSEASKDQQSDSVTGENNTCRCTCTCSEKCCQWKQHVHVQFSICNLFSVEKATFQREKWLAML